jgi:small subunit ribosomal protein S20
MKKLQRAITAGDKTAADQLLRPTISAIDKAIQKGAIHHNAADRYKSQLTSAYNRIAAKTA